MAATMIAAPALAQDPQEAAIRLELNALQATQSACRLTLVATNGLETDIAKVAYEFVFFGREGRVELLTALDLRDLPVNRTRVRQFDLPGVDCGGLSRLIVNDAKACESPGLTPAICLERLETSSKAGIPLEN